MRAFSTRSIWKSGLAAVWLGLLASAGWAQVPPVHPDLYATLRVAGFANPVELRQSGLKSRLDISSAGVLQAYIADREKGMLIALTAAGPSRTALIFPLDRNDAVVPLPLDLSVMSAKATLKAVGASIVNGRSCRLMEFANYLGQSGMICVTADNIILTMTKAGRREPLFEVTQLIVAKQDAKWFRPPPDYQVAVVPAIGGASSGVSVTGLAGTGDSGLPQQMLQVVPPPSPNAPPSRDPLPKVIYKDKTKISGH